MVFKVSFVIIINLFTWLVGRQTNSSFSPWFVRSTILVVASFCPFSHGNFAKLPFFNQFLFVSLSAPRIIARIMLKWCTTTYSTSGEEKRILFDGVLLQWWRECFSSCLYACHNVFMFFLLPALGKFLDTKNFERHLRTIWLFFVSS